jgi:hypothetical protein
MPTIRHKSKLAKTPLVLLAMLFTFLAVLAVRPLASLAAPIEPEPPQLAIEPGSYDFGLLPLNWGSRETSFQLRNTGSETLQVGSPEIVGPGHEAFWTGYSPCYGSFLQPGESCTAQVYFGPHEAVEYVAQFRVNVGSYSFSADLSGTGGRATFSPTSNLTDFGVAKVGSAGTTREIEITNTGNMPGGVFIAVIAGGAIGSFQILDENCTGIELVPAATCTLQVRFQPVSEGVKKAMLGLFGESEGPTPIVLTGVGAASDPPSGISSGSTAGVAATAADDSSQPTAQGQKRKPKVHRRYRRHSFRAAVHGARLVLRASE